MRRHAVTRAEPPDGQDDGRVSLHPLTFEEAMKALLETPPAKRDRKATHRVGDQGEAIPDEQGGHDGDGS